MIRHTKIGQAILFMVLLLSGGVYAEGLGETPQDSCRLIDGVYSNIGWENEWGNKGTENIKKPTTLIWAAFGKYLPSYKEDNVDAVRIKNNIQNLILNVETQLKAFEGDKPPYEPINFSYEYDDCVDGKIVYTETYPRVITPIISEYGRRLKVMLWIDNDQSLVAHGVFKWTRFFFPIPIPIKGHGEYSFTFPRLFDRWADQGGGPAGGARPDEAASQ